jgi:hypothetical protein
MKNISLTIFVIFLILFFEGTNSFSTKNTFVKISNAVESLTHLNTNLESTVLNNNFNNFSNKFTKRKSDEELDLLRYTNYPTFLNKGFKCMAHKGEFTIKTEFCANPKQKCVSSGIVMMGPFKDNEYKVLIISPGNEVECDASDFGVTDQKNDDKKCFTQKIEDIDTTADKKDIDADLSFHRACIKGSKMTEGVIVKQGDKAKCNKKTFDDASGDCKCYALSIPFDDSVKEYYYAVRFNTDGDFQCISGNGKTCTGLKKQSTCIAMLLAEGESSKIKIEDKNIITAELELQITMYAFFFNRWICPKESGLRVSIMYKSNDNGGTYSVNCLSRNGDDCIYEENGGQEACEYVNTCSNAERREFNSLQCGSGRQKDLWGNNGFDTTLETWCKSAAAWIRFDGSVEFTLAKEQKMGLVLMPDGQSACIPAMSKSDICMTEKDDKKWEKMILLFKTNVKYYDRLLECTGIMLRRAIGNPYHFCNKPLMTPNKEGNFKSKLVLDLLVGSGKSKIVANSFRANKFSPAKSWYESFANQKPLKNQDSNPRFLEDVNGDGIKDVIGFGLDGVYVSLGTSKNTFLKPELWSKRYGTNDGWNKNMEKFISDFNNDGKADIIVFGEKCVEVALSDGAGFGQHKCVNYFFTSDKGFKYNNKFLRLVEDINGDGYADLIGFKGDGVWLAVNNRGILAEEEKIVDYFGYNNNRGSFYNNKHPRYVIDINGDGCKDIVGFQNKGVYVALGEDKCTKWANYEKWHSNYSYGSGGWRANIHPRYFADMNNDGKLDLVGIGGSKIFVSYNKGDKFENKQNVVYANKDFLWSCCKLRTERHYRFLQDMNEDGYPDLVAFRDSDVVVSLWNSKSKKFNIATKWASDFHKNDGFLKNQGGHIILKNMNNNDKKGIPEVVAFGRDGFYVAEIDKDKKDKFTMAAYQWGNLSIGFGLRNGKKWREDISGSHIRLIKDINGDGLPDAVAWTDSQLIYNLNTGNGFQGDRLANSSMCRWGNKWNIRTFVDINKDGLAEMIGFGTVSTRLLFPKKEKNGELKWGSQKTMKQFNIRQYGKSSSQVWSLEKHYREIVDLNNDGYPDIIGFYNDKVKVAINNPKAKDHFDTVKDWSGNLCYNSGWRVSKHIRIIIDVNKDGYSDVVGFGDDGVYVLINKEGKSFEKEKSFSKDFGVKDGYTKENHPRFLIDMNKDKYPDIVAFGDNGVYVSLNNKGKSFDKPVLFTEEFGFRDGWVSKFKREIIDMNKDGLPDIVGFHDDGVYVALNTGKSFKKAELWSNNFGNSKNAGDWDNDMHRAIEDMNGDGYPDVVGIKDNTIYVGLNMIG